MFGVTLVDGRTTDGRTECEDRARILETEFAIPLRAWFDVRLGDGG